MTQEELLALQADLATREQELIREHAGLSSERELTFQERDRFLQDISCDRRKLEEVHVQLRAEMEQARRELARDPAEW